MERMTFSAECENGIFVLSISGELDIYTLPKVKQAAEMLMERGIRQMVLNLSGLSHLDSTAIGFLVQLDRRLKAERGMLCLSSPTPEVFEIFRVTRSDRLFKFGNTVTEAIAGLNSSTLEKPSSPVR